MPPQSRLSVFPVITPTSQYERKRRPLCRLGPIEPRAVIHVHHSHVAAGVRGVVCTTGGSGAPSTGRPSQIPHAHRPVSLGCVGLQGHYDANARWRSTLGVAGSLESHNSTLLRLREPESPPQSHIFVNRALADATFECPGGVRSGVLGWTGGPTELAVCGPVRRSAVGRVGAGLGAGGVHFHRAALSPHTDLTQKTVGSQLQIQNWVMGWANSSSPSSHCPKWALQPCPGSWNGRGGSNPARRPHWRWLAVAPRGYL